MKAISITVIVTFGLIIAVFTKSIQDVKAERSYHRAKEAVLWSQPVIGVAMTLKAIRDNGGDIDDIVYLSKPSNWKWRILTTNFQSLYITGVFKTSLADPFVIEVPPRSERIDIFGTIMDSFQLPLADVGSKGDENGKGSKYLLLPNGFK